MKAKHSTLETKHFVKERWDPLLIMTIRVMKETMVNEVNMDFRIPGLPHPVVKHAQNTSIRELIQKIENHPDRHALQQDLRQEQPVYRIKENDSWIARDGSQKRSAKERLSYWNVGIVCCTCGHFLQKETEANRHFVKYTMNLLSLPEYVIKKGRPHGHRYGKKPRDKEYYLATQKKKKCKQKRSKESLTDPYEIMNSVSEWLNIIEMKKFVDDGMFLQMKITLIICQKKNTSITTTNGGFIQISKVLIPCHWEIVLISSKRCLPWNDYNKKQEKNHTCLLTLTSTNNGSWHRVHLLHGGIGKFLGGLLTVQKVKKEVSQVLSERCDPLLKVFRREPSKMAFKSSIYFAADGSFTAGVGLLWPTGGVKTTPRMATSSWRSICLYPGKNGGCTQIIENSKIGMSRYLDSSTTTQMA